MKSGDEAIISLKQGVDVVADIIKKTIGPNGTNVGVGRSVLDPLITNDAKLIVDAVEVPDEVQQFAIDKLKSVARTLNDHAGGGRKRAILFSQAIFNEVYTRYLDPNNFAVIQKPVMEIRRELKKACEEVVAKLKEKVVIISDPIQVEQVAFVASEDQDIAHKVAGLVAELGKDGDIAVDDSEGFTIETGITKGLEFKNGLMSPYMETNEMHEAVIETPDILVTNRKFQGHQQLVPLIKELIALGENKLVVIGDFDQAAISQFVMNRRNGFYVTAIRNPLPETLKDICALTGATYYDKDLDIPLTASLLGSADKIIATQDETLIMGGRGAGVPGRIDDLKNQLKDTESAFDKKALKERISKLSTGIGYIKVGAKTPDERDYLKPKVKDTVEAVQAAIAEGVVAGGGVALYEISQIVDNLLTRPIRAPYEVIKDSGVDNIGPEILDAFKIERMALEAAVEVVGLLITVADVIVQKNDPEDESKN